MNIVQSVTDRQSRPGQRTILCITASWANIRFQLRNKAQKFSGGDNVGVETSEEN